MLVAAVGLSRFLVRSHALYDIDSVDFGLALRHFDPAVFQPHPPGYFLYVCLGRLVSLLIPDANAALVAVSIAASCGAAAILYLLTKAWFGERPAIVSLLLFLFSPLVWFHGTVALTYIVEAFFSALTGYLCWRSCSGERAFLLPASAVYALTAGFRPSAALLLLPLWLFTIYKERGARLWLAVATAGAVTLAWFVPMTTASGGLYSYFHSLSRLWFTVAGRRTTLASPWLAVARILTMAWIIVLILGFAAVFAVWPRLDRKSPPLGFLWAWIAPGALFFAFVFLNFVNSGYLLILCPPIFAFAAARLDAWIAGGSHLAWKRSALAAGLAANAAVFLFAPLYCSYRSVRSFERDLSAITRDFSAGFDPQTTMILGFDAHFLGYRHAGYYLPEFLTVQYPEVTYEDGKRVFLMRGGETRVVGRVPLTGITRFALFPLPAGEEYLAYLTKLQMKLPAGTLQLARAGSRDVLTGPISALPLLLPETAR